MASNRGIQIGSAWFQRKLNLRPQHRGVHLITEEILKQVPELSQFAVGLCHIQSECPNRRPATNPPLVRFCCIFSRYFVISVERSVPLPLRDVMQ